MSVFREADVIYSFLKLYLTFFALACLGEENDE